jgi:hypothetical protein
MSIPRFPLLQAAAAALAIGVSAAADAQVTAPPTREQYLALVRQNAPDALKDVRKLVTNLLGVELAPDPLTKQFNIGAATAALFPGQSPFFDPNCRRLRTPTGNIDTGDCTAFLGTESGPGEYTRLSFSKNLGLGNLKYIKRDPVKDITSKDLIPIQISNDTAEKTARDFLGQVFGVPSAELQPPQPSGLPSSQTNLQVTNLAIRAANKAGDKLEKVVVLKTVTLQRAFKLPTPIDGPPIPGTAANIATKLTHVPGPGKATVAIGSRGVVGAAVGNWIDLRKDPNLTADRAKSVDKLLQEIADDLFNEGGGPVAEMRFQFVISSEWRGTFGFLLPAVQVAVLPVKRNLTEDEQNKLAGQTTTPFIREYALVERAEAEINAR